MMLSIRCSESASPSVPPRRAPSDTPSASFTTSTSRARSALFREWRRRARSWIVRAPRARARRDRAARCWTGCFHLRHERAARGEQRVLHLCVRGQDIWPRARRRSGRDLPRPCDTGRHPVRCIGCGEAETGRLGRAARRPASAVSAKASQPTAPTIATRAPSRAAATA